MPATGPSTYSEADRSTFSRQQCSIPSFDPRSSPSNVARPEVAPVRLAATAGVRAPPHEKAKASVKISSPGREAARNPRTRSPERATRTRSGPRPAPFVPARSSRTSPTRHVCQLATAAVPGAAFPGALTWHAAVTTSSTRSASACRWRRSISGRFETHLVDGLGGTRPAQVLHAEVLHVQGPLVCHRLGSFHSRVGGCVLARPRSCASGGANASLFWANRSGARGWLRTPFGRDGIFDQRRPPRIACRTPPARPTR